MFRRLLVALDASPHAQRALAEAIDLAATNNATLTIITVVPGRPAWSLSGAAGAPIGLRDVNQQAEGAYRNVLDAALERFPATYRYGRSSGMGLRVRRSSTRPRRTITI